MPSGQTESKETFSEPVQEALHRHGDYQDALDQWNAFVESNGEELVLWSFIRHEIESVHQRRQTWRKNEQKRSTFSWDNLGQNAQWLFSGGGTNFADLESALGVQQSTDGKGRQWYESFHVDESALRSLFENNPDKSAFRLVGEAAQQFKKPQGYCEFVNFGIEVAAHQALLEWTAYRLRSHVFFGGETVKSKSDLQNFTVKADDGSIAIPFQRALQDMSFPEQVDVLEEITRDLQETTTGLQFLRELTHDGMPGMNLLCLYDMEKNAQQQEFVMSEDGMKKGIIRDPIDEDGTDEAAATFRKITGQNERYALTGDGLTVPLVKIGSRLLVGISRHVGDRGRATHVKSGNDVTMKTLHHDGQISRRNVLLETLRQFSEVTGAVLGAASDDAELAERIDGWNEGDVNVAVNKLRKAGRTSLQISSGPAPAESPSVTPYDDLIADIERWHGYVSTFQAALSTSLEETSLTRLKGYTAGIGVLQSSVGGAFFVYDMVFAEDGSQQRRDALDQVSAAFGVIEGYVGFYEGLETVSRHAVKVRNGEDIAMFVEELGEELGPGEEPLNNPKLDVRLGGVTTVASVYDAGMSAYQSYRLFEVGDGDAAIVTATMASVAVAEVTSKVFSLGLFAGPVGVVAGLGQLALGIWVQHLKDPTVITWMTNTDFGTMSISDFEDPNQVFFHFVENGKMSEGEKEIRQLSEYLSMKIGLTLPGQGAASALLGSQALQRTTNQGRNVGVLEILPIKGCGPGSVLHVKPIVDDGEDKIVKSPIHSITIPPTPMGKSSGYTKSDVAPGAPASDVGWEVRGVDGNAALRLMLKTNEKAFGLSEAPPSSFRNSNDIWGVRLVFSGRSNYGYFVEPSLGSVSTATDGTWGIEIVHETPLVSKAVRNFLGNALQSNQSAASTALAERTPYPRSRVPGDWW